MFGKGKKATERQDELVITVTEDGSGYPAVVTVVVTRPPRYGYVSCPDGFGQVQTGEEEKCVFSRAVGGAKNGEISAALTKWIQTLAASVSLHGLKKGTVITLNRASIVVSNPKEVTRL